MQKQKLLRSSEIVPRLTPHFRSAPVPCFPRLSFQFWNEPLYKEAKLWPHQQ